MLALISLSTDNTSALRKPITSHNNIHNNIHHMNICKISLMWA